MLPGTEDYLAREAIARALAALAPKLPDAERERRSRPPRSRSPRPAPPRKRPRGRDAIAALLPADPRAATAEIVEALKYPTATGAPSDILLAALAKPGRRSTGHRRQDATRPGRRWTGLKITCPPTLA